MTQYSLMRTDNETIPPRFSRFAIACLLFCLCLILSAQSTLAAEAEELQDDEAQLLPQPVTAIPPTVVATEDYYDPLQGLNRGIFAFNDVVYRYALIPLGSGYELVLPGPVRRGIAGIFGNLREPLNMINHGLQGEFSSAGTNVLRFLSNSTLGILGIFDPAANWFGLPDTDTTLNETLMRYRIGQGPYLVLPFLGPSDFRNGTSTLLQSWAHPLRYVTETPESSYWIIFDNFQRNSTTLSRYTELKNQSDDPYLYFRNQYLQGIARDEQALPQAGAQKQPQTQMPTE